MPKMAQGHNHLGGEKIEIGVFDMSKNEIPFGVDALMKKESLEMFCKHKG